MEGERECGAECKLNGDNISDRKSKNKLGTLSIIWDIDINIYWCSLQTKNIQITILIDIHINYFSRINAIYYR